MTADEARAALQYLVRFISARGWTRGPQGSQFEDFTPPAELQLPNGFSLAIPKSTTAPDLPMFVERLATTLADIYAHPVEQLTPVLQRAHTVLSIAIDGHDTSDGAIGFGRFEAAIEELKRLISDTAVFTSDEEPTTDDPSAEVISFVDSCRFLQTARGSFVISIEMPDELVIREASLLSPATVFGSDVSAKLATVLSFVTKQVFSRSPEIYEADHRDVPPVLSSVSD